jgi:hypothetical protein
MLIIAHRGNLNGAKPEKENHPDYIDAAIKAGFVVEVDFRKHGMGLWLGHDAPQYNIDNDFLLARRNRLIIHCKNVEALHYCGGTSFHHFAHDKDDVVLTSDGLIWTYPCRDIQLTDMSIPVVLGRHDTIWPFDELKNCYGICTDSALYYDALFNATAT